VEIHEQLADTTSPMPMPLSIVMGVSNIIMANHNMCTCLTLPAMHMVNGDVNLLACKEHIFKEKDKIPNAPTTKTTDPKELSIFADQS
jgi:hypothetical protein